VSSSETGLVRLESKLVPRPWGGEIWFEPAAGPLPLLIKFIYTHEALSYQVHPGDEYAARHHNSRGKTEMWYVANATAEAKIGLGLKRPLTKEQLRDAALTGNIEGFLNWVTPQRGDAFFTPAGTIHAIGAGVELWEIQENSDITYRLFDYGRGRELHLEHALQVSNLDVFDPAPARLPICCPWFCVDKVNGTQEHHPAADKYQLLICMLGQGLVSGAAFKQGEVWMIPAGVPFDLQSAAGAELLCAREA